MDSMWIASSYAALISVSVVGTTTSTSFLFGPVFTTPRSVDILLSPFVPQETSLRSMRYGSREHDDQVSKAMRQ